MEQTVLDVETMLKRALARTALDYVGIKEVGGNNAGQMVERFQKAVDGKAAGEPWCLSFIWYCIHEAQDMIDAIMGKQNQKHLLKPSEHVLTMWKKSSTDQRVICPEVGDLILWNYLDQKGKPTIYGHVGILVQQLDHTLWRVVEGNTSNGAVESKQRDIRYHYGRMVPMGILSVW